MGHAPACLQARRGQGECAKRPRTADRDIKVSAARWSPKRSQCSPPPRPSPLLLARDGCWSVPRYQQHVHRRIVRADMHVGARGPTRLACRVPRPSHTAGRVQQRACAAKHPAQGDGDFQHPVQGEHRRRQDATQQVGAQTVRHSICGCSAGKELSAHFSASRCTQGQQR